MDSPSTDPFVQDRHDSYMAESPVLDLMEANQMLYSNMPVFAAPEDGHLEEDWFSSFLDDQPVLSHTLMEDAGPAPCIKSEHSYSVSEVRPDSVGHLLLEPPQQQEAALDLTVKPMKTLQPSDQHLSDGPPQVPSPPAVCHWVTDLSWQVKEETEQNMELPTVTFTTALGLPPTPPSSSSDDSEACTSPQMVAPLSPPGDNCFLQHMSLDSSLIEAAFSQPFFFNSMSTSGVLILSEEERRTLISEGYPIPCKLPLTKQEEKNLKKIRRKIKNKISAQESRRKKKEYLEALEKRVESYSHENNDLKHKLDSLENNNRSLLSQLQKLQSVVSQLPKSTSVRQTGTALMVLVFCFAVFLGSMSPANLNIGYPLRAPARLPPQWSTPAAGGHPHPSTSQARQLSRVSSASSSRTLATADLGLELCDGFQPLPWEQQKAACVASRPKSKNQPHPGVDLLGAALIPTGGRTIPESRVVKVISASRPLINGSGSAHGGQHDRLLLPELTTHHQDLVQLKQILNLSQELGAV